MAQIYTNLTLELCKRRVQTRSAFYQRGLKCRTGNIPRVELCTNQAWRSKNIKLYKCTDETAHVQSDAFTESTFRSVKHLHGRLLTSKFKSHK